DSAAQFNLALTLGSEPAEQIAAFGRAIELDPDMVAAYESLGAALYTAGRQQEATETFRKGLMVDPLSAKLNYNLGLILMQQGEKAEGERRMELAQKADASTGGKRQ
ncbi:MAG: tetratricopeptide repeat protein, partial [Acidobacteriota bacterium]|nr:tetratricopeptide repeat protein [Acidobacteriota bacterium]